MSHEHNTFYNPPQATPTDVRAALDREDIYAAANAMVGCVLYAGGDWRELQELYLGLLDHGDRQVEALAATCLGHLARVYRHLDEERVVDALRQVSLKPHVRATAANALSDIRIFMHPGRMRRRTCLRRLVRPWTWF